MGALLATCVLFWSAPAASASNIFGCSEPTTVTQWSCDAGGFVGAATATWTAKKLFTFMNNLVNEYASTGGVSETMDGFVTFLKGLADPNALGAFVETDAMMDEIAYGDTDGVDSLPEKDLIQETEDGTYDFAEAAGFDEGGQDFLDAISSALQYSDAHEASAISEVASEDEGMGGQWLDVLGPDGEGMIGAVTDLVPVVSLGAGLSALLIDDFTTGTNPISTFLFGSPSTQTDSDYGDTDTVAAMRWEAIPLLGESLGVGPIGMPSGDGSQEYCGVPTPAPPTCTEGQHYVVSSSEWSACAAVGGCNTGFVFGNNCCSGSAPNVNPDIGKLALPNTGKVGYVLQFQLSGDSTWYSVGLQTINDASDSVIDTTELSQYSSNTGCLSWPGSNYTNQEGWAPTPPHSTVVTDPSASDILSGYGTFPSPGGYGLQCYYDGDTSSPIQIGQQAQAVYRTSDQPLEYGAPSHSNGTCPSGASCTTVTENPPPNNFADWANVLNKVGAALNGAASDVGNYLTTVSLGNPQPDTAYSELEIPQPYPNEIATDYKTTLIGDGFTDVTIDTLPDDQTDTSVGPDALVSVSPSPGTYAAPGTAITIEANPSDAPAPAPSGNPFPSVTVPALSLPSVGTPCTVFPFGVPCWIASQLNQFNATPVAPQFTVGLPWGQNLDVNFGDVFGADLSDVMDVVRPVLLVLSFLGIMVWLAGIAMSGSTSGGSGGGDAE